MIDVSGRSASVLFAGGAHVDRRARALSPFALGASNPGTLSQSAGGAALNAATAWHGLGRPAVLWSARGGDPDGAFVAASLAATDISDLAVTWLDRPTASYTAVLDDRGELVAGIADMAIYERLQPRLLARSHLRAATEGCAGVLLDANLPEPTVAALADRFAAPRRVGAIGVSPAKVARLRPSLSRLDAVFLSRAEAASLAHATPATRLDLVADLLVELGARRVVITDGAQSALILAEGRLVQQTPVPVVPRDVTGAGDTLAGIAFGLFAAGLDFAEAVRLGMAAASIRIRDGGLPPPDEAAAAISAMAADMPPPEPVGERSRA